MVAHPVKLSTSSTEMRLCALRTRALRVSNGEKVWAWRVSRF
jgi:hypothetical protein